MRVHVPQLPNCMILLCQAFLYRPEVDVLFLQGFLDPEHILPVLGNGRAVVFQKSFGILDVLVRNKMRDSIALTETLRES